MATTWCSAPLPHAPSSALECLGGNGYVEESGLPRLYRQQPVQSLWEGSGNVICLDVVRALRRTPDTLDAFRAWFVDGGALPLDAPAADAVTHLLARERFDLLWVTFSGMHLAGHYLWTSPAARTADVAGGAALAQAGQHGRPADSTGALIAFPTVAVFDTMVLGGLALVWIGYRLLLPDADKGESHEPAATTFWGAMRTIVPSTV